jgi:hypothetical protein
VSVVTLCFNLTCSSLSVDASIKRTPVYSCATAHFHKLSSLLRVHPSLWLVYEGVLLLTGAPLDDSASMPFVRSGAPANVFTYSAYSTNTGSPVPPPHPAFSHLLQKEKGKGIFYLLPACKSPAALSRLQLTRRQPLTNVNSVEAIIPLRRDGSCIASFCIGNNYRDLTAASLCVRLLQTHLLHSLH